MEHRYNRRVPIKINVLVYKKGLPVAIGQTRNLAMTGMFLEMSPGAFTKHSMIEIEFTGAEKPRIPAFVVNCAADGYGLEFDISIKEVQQAIRSLMDSINSDEITERVEDNDYFAELIKNKN